MGEKYDGVRSCYNPIQSIVYLTKIKEEEQKYKKEEEVICLEVNRYTRTGNKVHLLPSIINSIPDIFIDAELWCDHIYYLYIKFKLLLILFN